ncbi:hypothetical protein [Aminobacter sp. AP02]|uniref:hypothetical protein n=1 Tax=Aminobacter sp. AP02 TaxID=2135737 RepID=UPI000D7B131B|nr:hypothetical protein [Aminobacter sp. AP02]PWK60743.1 hypothetical protein C8K44_1367 [Aminobacter sp. AP02]
MNNTYLTYWLSDTTSAAGLVIAVMGLLVAAAGYSRASKALVAVLDSPDNREFRHRVATSSKWASRGLWVAFLGIGIQAVAALFVLIVY